MQGEIGAALMRRHGLDPQAPGSILVIEGPRARKHSDAVLSIFEGLGYPWRLASLFRVIPAFVRDPVYRWIARNRYRIFGKRQTCWTAPEEFRNRVL